MTHALVKLQSLAEDLLLAGVEGQTNDKLCSSGEGETNGKDLPVSTFMTIIMGVWLMAHP